jgi:hypothetical protein
MLKAILTLGLLFAGSAGTAAGTGPQIAYVKAGTYSEIYLVEPDGSRLRQLYRSGLRLRIFTLDMKPGGGELAFEEVSCCSATNATLKIVRYDNAGTRLETKSLAVCRISSLDYHPSGSDLLYYDSCAGARRLDTSTMTSTPLGIPSGVNKVGWRNAAELVYNRSTAAASDMLVAPLSDPGSATLVGTTDLAESMDVSTAADRVLVDPVDYGFLDMFNLNSGANTTNFQIGHYGRFSPDDQYVVYVTGYDVRGSYVMIRRTDGAGAPFRLASKGPFGALDWRN